MKTDYFSDLLPDFVTAVTSNKTKAVTHEKQGNKPENKDLQEALPVLPLLPQKTGSADNPAERREFRAFRYRLKDISGNLTLIAPGTSLSEASEGLRRRFGERLIDVTEYKYKRHAPAADGAR